MHAIEFKFGIHITGHRRTSPFDFSEYRMNSFFYRSSEKNSYTLRLIESNSSKFSSIQTAHSIEFKFGMYIIGHRLTYRVDFGEFRFNSFFTGIQKRILMHYSLWSQIIRSVLEYIQWFPLS